RRRPMRASEGPSRDSARLGAPSGDHRAGAPARARRLERLAPAHRNAPAPRERPGAGEPTAREEARMGSLSQHNLSNARPALYLPVSSEEQRDRETVENQREAANAYFARHDITSWTEYRDEAVSGTIPLSQRPDGARLLADAAAGRVTMVYVTRADRLGRDARH